MTAREIANEIAEVAKILQDAVSAQTSGDIILSTASHVVMAEWQQKESLRREQAVADAVDKSLLGMQQQLKKGFAS